MTIDYTITLIDLVRFNLLHHASRRVLNWMIIAGGALFLSRTMPSGQPGVRLAAFFIFTICLTLTVFGSTALISCVSYRPSKNRGLWGKHCLTPTTETLMEETPVSQGTWSWAGIPKVSHNSAFVFIYTQQNAAHVVPARCFANRAEADRFWQFVVDTWKTARAGA